MRYTPTLRVIGIGVGVDQKVVAGGYLRHYYENMSMLLYVSYFTMQVNRRHYYENMSMLR